MTLSSEALVLHTSPRCVSLSLSPLLRPHRVYRSLIVFPTALSSLLLPMFDHFLSRRTWFYDSYTHRILVLLHPRSIPQGWTQQQTPQRDALLGWTYTPNTATAILALHMLEVGMCWSVEVAGGDTGHYTTEEALFLITLCASLRGVC